MEFNFVTHLQSCTQIIEANAAFVKLIYYSHIPVSLIALLVGGFVYLKGPKDLLSRTLLAVTLAFSFWAALDLIAWLSTDSRYIMFVWSLQGLANPLIFVCTYYFIFVFINGRDIALKHKLLIGLGLLPIVIFTPTYWNLTGFNLANCEAVEGANFVHYYYAVNLIFFIATLFVEIRGYLKASKARIQILLLSIGVNCFLASFFVTGYLSSMLANYNLVVYGLFGMILFLGFLTFLIVRYQAFNLKLLGAQALVVGLIMLIGSQLFFIRELTSYILVSMTFVCASLFGIFLIRSVKQEVERKEELQLLSNRLAIANTELHRLDTAKSEFISIASHQLRTPLTAIKGFVSLLLEGAYGRVEPAVSDTLNKVYLANARLMNLVENLLNISRIEAGRIQYQFAPTNIEDILNELRDLFLLATHEKGLALKFFIPKQLPLVSLDMAKIREVISNVIDNAIKYTEKGTVTVAVKAEASKVIITVADTGVGIDPEDLPHLFKKFERGKNAAQVNVSSTGLGLYVGKSFIEAHGGTIRAESAGRGKGASFIMELPLKPVALEKKA